MIFYERGERQSTSQRAQLPITLSGALGGIGRRKAIYEFAKATWGLKDAQGDRGQFFV